MVAKFESLYRPKEFEMSKLNRAVMALATAAALVAAVPAAAQNLAAAADTEKVLLDVKWWGGGIDGRRPGCNTEKCMGSIAFRFQRNVSGKLEVFIVWKSGRHPYISYSEGKRYPGDTEAESVSTVPVTVDNAGGFNFQNHFQWTCRLVGAEKATCSRIRERDWKDTFTVARLPPGITAAH
jgi:hypothetical protein